VSSHVAPFGVASAVSTDGGGGYRSQQLRRTWWPVAVKYALARAAS